MFDAEMTMSRGKRFLDNLTGIIRGTDLDRAKARAYLANRFDETLREQVGDYDMFVSEMLKVKDPALSIGTAKDSVGSEIAVRQGFKDAACHWLIQGSTGSGKTSFVTHVLAEMLLHGRPIGVVDCKSGFFDASLRWAGAVAYDMGELRRKDFIRSLSVINPFSDALVPLNICRCLEGTQPEIQAYEVGLSLSRLFNSSMSFQMENILHHLLLLLMEADLSLVEAPQILRDETLRGILLRHSRNQALKEFFLRTFMDIPAISTDALLSRLQSLLLPENLRLMLGADDLMDFKGSLNRGNPIFIFLGKGDGVPEEQVAVIGSLLLQLLFQAAYAGGSARKRPYQLVLDEFFHLIKAPALSQRFETALTSLRSYGVMLTLVMHYFIQVSPALRASILNSCELMAIFKNESENSHYFGDFLPEIDPEDVAKELQKSGRAPSKQEMRGRHLENLQRLPKQHCYWYDRTKPYRAILLRTADLPQSHEAIGVSARELDEFISSWGVRRGGFALAKDVLRRQIEARQKRLKEIERPPVHVQASKPSTPACDEGNAGKGKKTRKPRLG